MPRRRRRARRSSQNQIVDLTRDQATARFDGVRVAARDAIVAPRRRAARSRRAWPAILATSPPTSAAPASGSSRPPPSTRSTRKQFERPIGFFQAVKHPLVNVMIAIDRARSLLYHAACVHRHGRARSALAAARMAKSAASDAAAFVSDRSIQLHGGIGFTWECDVHLYFKRSLHNQVLYGDGVHHRRHLADVLIGPIASGAGSAS